MTTKLTEEQFLQKPPQYDRTPRPYPVITQPVVTRPVVIETSPGGCNCAQDSGFEQKIKENPLIFVLGALLVGYLLAKN